MHVRRLDVNNVRNIRSQTLYPSPAFNFIYGKNASGKSALIEAIYLLGRAKSFRTATIKSVICFGQEHLMVTGQVEQPNGQSLQLGIQLNGKDVDIRINQQARQKRADLAYGLPLQIIHPKSFELLDAGAQIRREFLDWGLFNDDERFLTAWRNYKRALLHRNTLLKKKAINQLEVWNIELVIYGTIVTNYRQRYLQQLKPILIETTKRFFTHFDVDIRLVSGWDVNLTFEQCLIEDLEKDLRDGFTHNGSHRDDFQLLVDDKLAKEVVSRGQLKLLVICLKLAQVALIAKEKGALSCILIDDFAAELDKDIRAKCLQFINDMKCQVFVTATEKLEFGDLTSLENYKLFHVEQGVFNQIDVSRET